jgi:hypothetical protein
MGSLSDEMSRLLARREREAATEEALRGLTERAERLAGIMGLRFAGFREVGVDAPRMMPLPQPRSSTRAPSGSAAKARKGAARRRESRPMALA